MKICFKCNKDIKKDDNYVRVSDFRGSECVRETFFHKDCMEKDKKKKEFLTKMIAGMALRANKLMNRIENE